MTAHKVPPTLGGTLSDQGAPDRSGHPGAPCAENVGISTIPGAPDLPGHLGAPSSAKVPPSVPPAERGTLAGHARGTCVSKVEVRAWIAAAISAHVAESADLDDLTTWERGHLDGLVCALRIVRADA